MTHLDLVHHTRLHLTMAPPGEQCVNGINKKGETTIKKGRNKGKSDKKKRGQTKM